MIIGICTKCFEEVFSFESIEDKPHYVICGKCRMKQIEHRVKQELKAKVMNNG